ncbi:MAG TPA: TRAP transporter TatT component family protein [Anaeromyxobacteraceae bacterium]|nr:TRAP transporter TatT component family protein [Anaeromyxobacteraceae bacterium]
MPVKSSKNWLVLAALAPLVLSGCKTMGAKIAAGAFTGQGETFARDSDPELVRDAVPFALKTMESLLETLPDDVDLLRSLAANFTQYAYAFVQQDADLAEWEGRTAEARAGRERARKLFLRARGYGLRGLDVNYPGISAKLLAARDLDAALAQVKKEDVDLLYWTAAAWAMAISDGKSDMALVSQLPAPVAMMRRGLALDETFDQGAFHEFFVTYDGGRSAAEGGGPEVARRHMDRALELSGGQKLGVRVSWAETVLVQQQDRAAYEAELRRVLDFDVDSAPRFRLANLIAQRRARALLAHVDDLFA